MGRACLSPPVDCRDGGIVACTAGSGPDADARRQDARQGRGDAAGGGASPWCIPAADGHCRRPGWLALMDRYGLARSTGAKGRSPDDAAAEGVPRTHEDGIRPSRALGGAHPQRGARPGRRLHPLARPRAHQTAARLDESGAIPSEPGNGCVTISKKTSAAPLSPFENKSQKYCR